MTESLTEENKRLWPELEPMEEVLEKYASLISEMKSLLTRECEDSSTIYRWLRGYAFNPAEAADALNLTLEWREQNRADEISEIASKAVGSDMSTFPHGNLVARCFPKSRHGEDKNGQPITIDRMGMVNLPLLLRSLTKEQVTEHWVYTFEHYRGLALAKTKETGRLCRIVRVIDLTGMGAHLLDPAGLNLLRHLISLTTGNYVEMLAKLYIVNAPWIFASVWSQIEGHMRRTNLFAVLCVLT